MANERPASILCLSTDQTTARHEWLSDNKIGHGGISPLVTSRCLARSTSKCGLTSVMQPLATSEARVSPLLISWHTTHNIRPSDPPIKWKMNVTTGSEKFFKKQDSVACFGISSKMMDMIFSIFSVVMVRCGVCTIKLNQSIFSSFQLHVLSGILNLVSDCWRIWKVFLCETLEFEVGGWKGSHFSQRSNVTFSE